MAGLRFPLLMRARIHTTIVSILAVLAAGGFAVLAAHALAGFGGSGVSEPIDHWVYDALMVGPALVCLVAGLRAGPDRLAWILIGIGLLLWALGDVYWTFVLAGMKHAPYPSLADAGYLLWYPFALGGLALLARRRVGETTPTALLDCLIAGLAVVAIAAAFVLGPVLRELGGSLAEDLTTLAYPVGDAILLGFVAAVLILTGLRRELPWLLLLTGMAINGVADAVYSYQVTAGTYVEGTWLDLLWPLASIAIASAALAPAARGSRAASPLGAVLFAGALAVTVFALQFAHLFDRSDGIESTVASAFVAALALAVALRLVLAFADNHRLLAIAQTDPLTGLGNRGKLMVDIATLNGGSAHGPHVLALFDLDGFKLYNDSFGHPAGDALLARLGGRLAVTVGERGRAYRVGGDEFCVLINGSRVEGETVIEAASEALREHGEGFDVGNSFGAAEIPFEASSAETAIQLADRRMYRQKDSHRPSAGGEAKEALVGVLRERQPELGDHGDEVARLAAATGAELGLDPGKLEIITRAAELHDVGKVALPEALLSKPGPLDEDEWAFMRQHTLLGERIVSSARSLAPVARLVRSSHERFDGGGYPDRLAGEAIPLGARIIFACDAFDAMTSPRPYASARSIDDALAELRACAGTQFDPAVVEALCAVLQRGRAPANGSARTASERRAGRPPGLAVGLAGGHV